MALATSPDKRGFKRICTSCSTRFYDMNKRPIICPSCGTEFTGEVKVRTRRARASNDDDLPISKVQADDQEMELISDIPEEDEETISLEDADELDDDADDVDEDEIDADLDLDEADLDAEDFDEDEDDDSDDDDDDEDDDDDDEEDED